MQANQAFWARWNDSADSSDTTSGGQNNWWSGLSDRGFGGRWSRSESSGSQNDQTASTSRADWSPNRDSDGADVGRWARTEDRGSEGGSRGGSWDGVWDRMGSWWRDRDGTGSTDSDTSDDTTSGDTTDPVDTGDTTDPVDTGDTTDPVDTGDTTDPVDTGDTTDPVDTGDTTDPVDTGDTTDPVDAGGTDTGSADGDAADTSGSGDTAPADLVTATQAIETTHDGQVIENMDLYVESGSAITVSHDNVIIRNCRIHHDQGAGIELNGANNVTIESSEVIRTGTPEGQEGAASPDFINITAANSSNLTVQDVIVRDGSSGIYLMDSPGANISSVEGHDFHGPFPRGQFVQFNRSGDATLTDFYAVNDPANSHPEDVVSVYESPNVSISNGTIDGNNSVSGVGIMFEGASEGGVVENVDAIHQGNGAFSSYTDGIDFIDTRSFDNFASDQGRGDPSSNGLIWNVSANDVSIMDSTYTRAGDPNNIGWDLSLADVAEIEQDPDAVPHAPHSVDLAWA